MLEEYEKTLEILKEKKNKLINKIKEDRESKDDINNLIIKYML